MKKLILLAAILVTGQSGLFAANGDTTVVTTHLNETVVTNPAAGWNEYRKWGVFPGTSTDYRKVFVKMSYECPTGMNCGEWDYIDQIYLRRTGSIDSASQDIELVRFITPYGLQFTSLWNFQWTMDITDFAGFLHDSVEIGYIHTGYETNVGRGWSVTLDFYMIEGTPVAPFQSITPLWNGSFGFGNGSDPIENHLVSVSKTFGNSASTARVRVNHTGHGSDNSGCSEFCNAYRDLKFDGSFVERIQRWRKCGDNAVYPQGGTWVYDRGNWCPGAVVYPYIRDFQVAPNSNHSFDIDMEPYTTASPSGNEYVVGYLFEYGAPSASLDASIEEVLEPSDMKQYSRHNPICAQPRIIIRNNGSTTLTSATFTYGFNGQPQLNYNWTGSIAYGKQDTISLPGVLVAVTGQATFTVNLSAPNGGTDEYPLDNTHTAGAVIPPAYSINTIVLEFKTNNEPQDNGYRLVDGDNNIIFERPMGSMPANTLYKDTLTLPNGCYRFIVDDMDDGGGDGLAFWANNNDGTGYARLRSLNNILKSFSADFGSLIDYSFTLGTVSTSVQELPVSPDIVVYPNPNTGSFTIDFASNQSGNAKVEVIDAMGRIVHSDTYYHSGNMKQNIHLGGVSAGIYYVRISNGDWITTKTISISR